MAKRRRRKASRLDRAKKAASRSLKSFRRSAKSIRKSAGKSFKATKKFLGIKTRRKRSLKSRKPREHKRGNLVFGTFRSAPGEPPMKQTGRLLGSIAIEPIRERVIARVGTNVAYGRYLEFGTRHMKARPWLRRALIEQQRNIQAVLSRPFVVR